MKEISCLVKRNVLVFVRDYSAVFFSVLSMLIVLGLMVIFLGGMNSEAVVNALEEFGGTRDVDRDEANAKYLIQMWTLAGILVVNSVTVTLTVMGGMVQDETRGRLASFYVAPVARIKIALGYMIAAWLIATCMCMLTLVVGEIYMAIQGWPLLPVEAWVKVFGMIMLNAFVYAALGYLLALFVRSESGWSGFLTVIGTLVGFLGAIYLPMSQLPEGVGNVLKCLPVLHGAAMMRVVLTEAAMEETFVGLPEMVTEVFKEEMGVTIMAGGNEVTLVSQVLFLLAYGIIAIVIAAVISKRRKVRDR